MITKEQYKYDGLVKHIPTGRIGNMWEFGYSHAQVTEPDSVWIDFGGPYYERVKFEDLDVLFHRC